MSTLELNKELSDEDIDMIKKILDDYFIEKLGGEKLFKPKMEEIFYYLDIRGESSLSEYTNCYYDTFCDFDNCFKTRKEAEKEAEKRRAIRRIKEHISENFGFNSTNNTVVFYNTEKKCFEFSDSDSSFKYYSPFGYLKKTQDAQKLIQDKQEDLKIVFDISD